MPETLSLSAVKARLSEPVDRVHREDERIVVTRNGRPAAVLPSPDDLESRRGLYCAVYELDDATREVNVVAVGHRADIYRRR